MSENNENFLRYYLPCLFLLLSATLLGIGFVLLFNSSNFSFIAVMITAFASHRRYVSGWVPNIRDYKKTLAKAEHDHKITEAQVMTGVKHSNALLMSKPGVLDKISFWIGNKIFSFLVLCLIWVPMEFYIQTKFLIGAVSAYKNGEFLTMRRGLWPKEKIKDTT